MTNINSVFFSSFKLERIHKLSQHISKYGIDISVEAISQRNPLLIFRTLLRQPSDAILLTHEWMMIPILFAILNLVKGNSYLLILNGVLWDAWFDYGWSRMRMSFYNQVFKFVTKRSSAVVCNSNYLYDRLLYRFPELLEKAIVIHNAIDDPSKPNFVPQVYGEGFSHFVTVTNFEYPRKFIGLNLIFDAMKYLDDVGIKLHILGKVLTNTGKIAATNFIRNAKESYPTIDYQIYLNANVLHYLQPEKSVFIYSSGQGGDSLPRAILEAQSIGMPCVIIDTNGCGEAVISGKSALLVSPIVEDVVKAIKDTIAPEFDRASMSEQAIQNIKTRFSWDSMAIAYCHQLKTIYKD